MSRRIFIHMRYIVRKQLSVNAASTNLFCWKRSIGSYTNEDIPKTSATDMRRILKLNGFLVEDGFVCLLTKCPICKSTSNSNIGQAYINKTTGFFLCSSCQNSGPWSALENIIKKPNNVNNAQLEKSIKKINENHFKIWENIIPHTVGFSDMTDDVIQNLLRSFELPIVPEPSKVLPNIRYSSDTNCLYFPVQDLSNRYVGYISCQHGVSHYLTEPPEESVGILLLKIGRWNPKDSLIIVPTVGDALSIIAQKISASVACLPHGLKNLPQEILPIFERWHKIIIWMGVDGISHIKTLSRKLGESRCLIVKATSSHPTAQEALRNEMDLKSILASASPVLHKSITTFKSLREDVLADLQNIEKVQGVKWKRFPILNKLLRGHRSGELTVLTGPTGCGKTTFCSEYSLDLAIQGVNTLWGSFEIRNTRLMRTMLQQLAGFPLEEDLNQFDKFANLYENLPIHFLMFHGQQSIKEVMEAVEHACYVHDISHIIIDNVQFMLGVGDESSKHSERFWKQDSVIAAFRTFATRSNCHVTLVMHPRKERDDDLSTNSIFGSAKASQEADNVLIIQDKRLTAIRGKKYLQIAKNRYSGDLGIMPLEFDKSALSYAAKKVKTKEIESDAK